MPSSLLTFFFQSSDEWPVDMGAVEQIPPPIGGIEEGIGVKTTAPHSPPFNLSAANATAAAVSMK